MTIYILTKDSLIYLLFLCTLPLAFQPPLWYNICDRGNHRKETKMKVMKQGTIRGYLVSIEVINDEVARAVEGFGATPKKAVEDAKSRLTSDELMFGYIKICDPRKVKATYRVPLSDILTLRSCEVSGWYPED